MLSDSFREVVCFQRASEVVYRFQRGPIPHQFDGWKWLMRKFITVKNVVSNISGFVFCASNEVMTTPRGNYCAALFT